MPRTGGFTPTGRPAFPAGSSTNCRTRGGAHRLGGVAARRGCWRRHRVHRAVSAGGAAAADDRGVGAAGRGRRGPTQSRWARAVFHQKFGYGTVTAGDDDRLDVAFDKAGDKRVLDRFVETGVTPRATPAALETSPSSCPRTRWRPTRRRWRRPAPRSAFSVTTHRPLARRGRKGRAPTSRELAAALALAALVTGVPPRRARATAGGRLARAHPRGISRATGRPPLRRARHPSRGPRAAGSADHRARCRGGVRLGRARLDPRLPARAGARRVSPAAPDPRSRHRLRHPGDGGGAAAAPAGAGDRYRALVGAGRRARTRGATGSAGACGSSAPTAGARRRCRAAVPTIWCSPISWRARCA